MLEVFPEWMLIERKLFDCLVSPLSLFKNPMILLAVFALAVTFGMPKLLENSTHHINIYFEFCN